MEAGRLRYVITFQKEITTNVTSGDKTKTYEDIATVRADVQPIRGAEVVGAGEAINSIETLRFLIRADKRIYSPTGTDSGTKTSILHRGLRYNVKSVAPLHNVYGIEITAERVK